MSRKAAVQFLTDSKAKHSKEDRGPAIGNGTPLPSPPPPTPGPRLNPVSTSFYICFFTFVGPLEAMGI